MYACMLTYMCIIPCMKCGVLTTPQTTLSLLSLFGVGVGAIPMGVGPSCLGARGMCTRYYPNHSHLSCQLAFSLEKSTRPLISVHFHRPPAFCFVLVQMVQTFSRCILCSKDEVDLDELLAARLVTFLMDNYQEILKVPLVLQTSIEERVAHLRRVQVKGET